jgi:hypothetical protein
VAEEKFHSLSDAPADGVRRLVVYEMERREQFEELSLLRAWGAELCLAIVGLSQVRSHLLARMQAAALHHTELACELAAFWTIVSSSVSWCWGTRLMRPPGWKLRTS